jgi:hypothetical protein
VVGPSGAIASGSYRGPLPRVDLGPLGRPLSHRLFRRKKWVYAAVSAEDLFAAVAVVDLGYAKKAFAFACKDGAMLADRTALGPPGTGSVSDSIGDGSDARFGLGSTRVEIARRGQTIDVRAHFRGLSLEWAMDAGVTHPPLSAIGDVPGGGVNTTEKQVLLPATGAVTAGNVTHRIERAQGGYDYTHGYLTRHTQWRWAFFMGAADDGTPVAMNLVEGFLGERECALWVGGELVPVGEGRFDLDTRAPLSSWRVRTTCGAVDLLFRPWAMHAEDMNLGVIRAHFVQPIGVWEGTLRTAGRELRLSRVVGVAEDQDVLW